MAPRGPGSCCLTHFKLHFYQWFLFKLARYESKLKRKINELARHQHL